LHAPVCGKSIPVVAIGGVKVLKNAFAHTAKWLWSATYFCRMLAGLNNVTFEFGARLIVQGATWHIHPNERIGLIGYNGTGKSTLLRLLAGEYQPSAGQVERGRNLRMGFLHQDLLSQEFPKPVLEVAMDAFEEARRVQVLLTQLEDRLNAEPENEALLQQYAEALHDFEVAGGYTMEHHAAEVLHGLGFSNHDLTKPFNQFSGGWRMRVLLAKLILQQPDILLLDEPTNHLDLPSIEWLEKYLQHYKGSVVIVSHDKFFLDRMVTKIVELYQQRLYLYSGNFSFYEKEKVERIELQKRAYENQQEYIRQQERFIERFRAKATKAAQAQSAAKRLEKLERVEEAELERPDIRINFSVGQQPGKLICSLKQVSKAFGELKILDETDAEIYRGEKIALIGANGKGKSTMLRMIAGTETFSGERVWGHNVQEAFYAQHQLEALNPNNDLLQEMSQSGAAKTELEYRTLLGCFLFGGEEVEKKIKVLSGGEKARVALAKTIVSKANFLLLDEPTNHLDMHSVELLVEALNRYEGTYVLVSHDRYFISKTCTVFWEIIDQKIRAFRGTYEEYQEWKEKMTRQQQEASQSNGTHLAPAPGPVPSSLPASRPMQSRDDQKALQKLQSAFQKLEKQLEAGQQQLGEVQKKLSDPAIYANREQFTETEKQYQQLLNQVAQLQAEYEKQFEKLVALESGQAN
jgi:ATP-binding cassette subfamily F protein 3